jgi:long-chain acyl-CoA synthetase
MNLLPVNWGNSDRIALLTEQGEYLTYRQLHERVIAFANCLHSRRLAFLVGQNDVPTIIAYLGFLEASTVPLLLNRDISKESLNRLLEIYKPTYIFLPKDRPDSYFDCREVENFGCYRLLEDLKNRPSELHPELRLLLATSGSTGSPKLVRLSLRNISANAQSIAEYLGINEDERAITSLPFNYSYGLSVINSHLISGASLALTDRGFFDPLFWHQVKEQSVSSLAGVPYSYEILLKLKFDRMDLPKIRTLTQAGGRLDPAYVLKISEIALAKGMKFFVMYGQTEASPRIAYLSPEKITQKLGSIGCAIPGGILWIEDDKGNRIYTPNQTGELVYNGPNVSLGYAEKREDLLLGDMFKGVLHTGDIAWQDEDGYFFIEGRRHRFLKVFGLRIALDSVEAWLTRRGLVGAAYGQDDRLCVSIEGETNMDPLKYALALSMDFQIHPSAIRVKIMHSIPRLSSGKVDYSCLNTMQ